ncbi:FAD-dependent oxidoreductase [Aurantivibrio plasticivorans]
MTVNENEANNSWRLYICKACGLIYDEEQGDPDSGLAPGTRFEDIPDDWECPLCGVTKMDFEPYERPSLVAAPEPAQIGRRHADVVIVGAGLAGWQMAESLRALDSSLSITLITADSGDRYHKPELSLAISREQTPQSLVKETGSDAAARLGVYLLSNSYLTGISSACKNVRTTRGTLRYGALILALGAKPAWPPTLPQTLCWHVNHLATWQGFAETLGENQSIAIVGAGMVGCELAEDLTRSGHSVTLIDLAEQPLAALLPSEAAERLQQHFSAIGVTFIPGCAVQKVSLLDSGQRRCALSNESQIDVDHVVVATGLKTDARIAEAAGLDFECGIAVDPDCLQTSVDDIYALGDCISINGNPCRFIEPLAHQADTIAASITQIKPASYSHQSPVIRLKTPSLPIVMHGSPSHSLTWQTREASEDCLIMEQVDNGEIIARLQVG